MHETDLRWRLRQLSAEIEPPRDLWAGIADRIERPVRRRRPAWLAGFALAASVCVAVGLAWSLRVPSPAPAPPQAEPRVDAQAEQVRRQADALTAEYYAALREFEGAPMPAPLEPALATLDRSASDLRGALASDPEAVFLLDQLRRTYARRLSLTQRAVTG